MHPVLFQLGPLRLYSYGFLIALGGLASARFWWVRRERMGLRSEDDFWRLLNAILVGGFLGGRVMFMFEYTRPFSADFWRAAVSFSQGFSVMGAFIGVLAGIWWAARAAKAPLASVLDYVCAAAPLWHAFGRLGCFMAGCCYGRPTDVPWAVRFTAPLSMIEPALRGVPVHPTELYEAAGDAALAALLILIVLPRVEQSRQKPGTAAVLYFLGYSVIRFITEFFRGDVVNIPGVGLTAAQVMSVLMAAAAVAVYLYNARRQAAAPEAA